MAHVAGGPRGGQPERLHAPPACGRSAFGVVGFPHIVAPGLQDGANALKSQLVAL